MRRKQRAPRRRFLDEESEEDDEDDEDEEDRDQDVAEERNPGGATARVEASERAARAPTFDPSSSSPRRRGGPVVSAAPRSHPEVIDLVSSSDDEDERVARPANAAAATATTAAGTSRGGDDASAGAPRVSGKKRLRKARGKTGSTAFRRVIYGGAADHDHDHDHEARRSGAGTAERRETPDPAARAAAAAAAKKAAAKAARAGAARAAAGATRLDTHAPRAAAAKAAAKAPPAAVVLDGEDDEGERGGGGVGGKRGAGAGEGRERRPPPISSVAGGGEREGDGGSRLGDTRAAALRMFEDLVAASVGVDIVEARKVASAALGVETEIHGSHAGGRYNAKARECVAALNNNAQLARRVLDGEVTPRQLCEMRPEQRVAADHWRKETSKRLEHRAEIVDAAERNAGPEQVLLKGAKGEERIVTLRPGGGGGTGVVSESPPSPDSPAFPAFPASRAAETPSRAPPEREVAGGGADGPPRVEKIKHKTAAAAAVAPRPGSLPSDEVLPPPDTARFAEEIRRIVTRAMTPHRDPSHALHIPGVDYDAWIDKLVAKATATERGAWRPGDPPISRERLRERLGRHLQRSIRHARDRSRAANGDGPGPPQPPPPPPPQQQQQPGRGGGPGAESPRSEVSA